MKTISYFLSNESVLENLGGRLALVCPATAIIFLQGELGAGKTTFTRGFLRALGYTGAVKSPTYTWVESYSLKTHHVVHFDFYRVMNPDEVKAMGMQDYFSEGSVCIVEWPENTGNALPSPDVYCILAMKDEGREIILTAKTACGEEMLEKLCDQEPHA